MHMDRHRGDFENQLLSQSHMSRSKVDFQIDDIGKYLTLHWPCTAASL